MPTALIAVAKVSKATGEYGYKISISIPKIAGGAGSFSSAEFTIDRKWTYKGKKHSFLNAECANGHFDAQVEVAFGDGTERDRQRPPGLPGDGLSLSSSRSSSPSSRASQPSAYSSRSAERRAATAT